MSLSTPFGILKTLDACVIKSIKVTFAPTLIYGMAYGIGLRVTYNSNSYAWVLTTTIGASTNFVGKEKM